MIRMLWSGVASCLCAVLLPMGVCRADIVYLTVSADESRGTWEAFLQIEDAQNQTLGLAGIEFDVIGSDGLTVESSTVHLPVATESQDFQTFFQKGFFNFRSDGTSGRDIRAAQDLFNTVSSAGTGNNSILEGVGETAIVESNASLPGMSIGWPVRIASGTFSGGAGSLQVIGDTASTTLLPAMLPTAGGSIATFSPSQVVGTTVTITAIPEPTSFAMLSGIFVVGWISRRRTRTN